MAESLPVGVWSHRLLFVAVAVALLFLRLLPLGSLAGNWPGPDLLFCLTLVWVLRRPDCVPALLMAGVLLLEDMLLMRPPGLWAAMVVLSAEFLRSRVALTREVTFLVEWLLVAGVMLAATLGFRLVMALVMLPQASLGQALVQTLATILCYPAVVVASRLAFGIRKPATGETDAYGRRM